MASDDIQKSCNKACVCMCVCACVCVCVWGMGGGEGAGLEIPFMLSISSEHEQLIHRFEKYAKDVLSKK